MKGFTLVIVMSCVMSVTHSYAQFSTQKIIDSDAFGAWFAPEITLQFGPYESAGLPGLVLQYELAKFKWIVDTMRLDEKNSSIKIDKSGREITEEEIDLSIKKRKN